MSIIMENIFNGTQNQLELYADCIREGDFELAEQHWYAARLLSSLYADYIPCLSEEL